MSGSPLSDTGESAAEAALARRTRIDAAHTADAPGTDHQASGHVVADPEAADQRISSGAAAAGSPAAPLLEIDDQASPELILAVSGQTMTARREHLQLQAAQLASHLRERLREVDRREAHLNARASQLEADLRAGRLWFRERAHEFQEQERELKLRIEELEEHLRSRAAGPPVASVRAPVDGPDQAACLTAEPETPLDPYDVETRAAALTEREHLVRLKEDELRERRLDVERQAAALRHAQQLFEQERERERRDLAADRAAMAAEFGEQVRQLDLERQAWNQQRAAWEQRKALEEQTLRERERLSAETAAETSRRLEARQAWIERQKSGLEQVRTEILALHRQSLEMRLIAEQLWAQTAGRLAPSEATQAIAQTRLKLSEHYKLEETALESKRQELVALGERIAGQHAELKQSQAGLREWAAARQSEIEQQARTLVERELALESEYDRLREREHHWLAERRGMDQKIRDLMAEARAPVAA